MNQEQLINHVAELLRTAAETKPGAVLLYFDEEFKTIGLDTTLSNTAVFINAYNTGAILNGLPPSEWLKLSRQVWACKSTNPDHMKFPGLAGSERGRPGRRPKPPDEPSKVS